MSKLLHDSIAYALSHRKDAVDYAQQFGRGLDKEKTDKFVGMYVNDLTLGYGERGCKAVERLMTEAFDRGTDPATGPGRVCGVAANERQRVSHARERVGESEGRSPSDNR